MEGLAFAAINGVVYNDKREYLKFPITYNDVFTETFTGTLTGAFPTQRQGTVEIAANGYGQLILPYDTLYDVLRIRSVAIYQDTLFGGETGSYVDTIFTWYNTATNNHIASVALAYNFGGLTGATASYMDEADLLTGVNPVVESATKGQPLFYPNPVKDVLTISNADGYHTLEILDLRGTLIQSISLHQSNQTIDVADLPPGIYFLQAVSESGSYVRKVVVN